MSAVLHDCPGGCGHQVHAKRLACELCWRRLPGWVKAAIAEARQVCRLRPGDEEAVRAHTAAVDRAARWYREHPEGYL